MPAASFVSEQGEAFVRSRFEVAETYDAAERLDGVQDAARARIGLQEPRASADFYRPIAY